MKEIGLSFLEKIVRTRTVESFRFQLPQALDFIPGQFSQVIFDELNRDNKELNKYLSFSSSPTKKYIEVTKRLSESKFSQRLNVLKVNDELLFKTPLGSCVFQDSYKKIAFLIGGIGITPVISIIEYIMDKKLDTDVCLIYSNRTEEEIAFKNELDGWKLKNKNIKVSYVVTDCPPREATCIFGRIDEGLLKKYMCDMSQRVIFTFGPPKMVEAMNNLCLGMGCSKEQIKTEQFIGY
ncbi:MAG: FAD-dependent oxidoreductase [Candidatus Omnitrophica bacterium]|nr:FAD-dependent oxidoreductase [Candidatus Omnitrophota bacterium]